MGVLEITWYKFQLQKVRFRGSVQAKHVFEHLLLVLFKHPFEHPV